MNKTLQDRLVKELRLRGISTMADGNAFAPTFMADYNTRFARQPMNPHDAHRPLQPGDDLSQIFTWQEERTMTRNLVVHFKRLTYLIVPSPVALTLAGRRVLVHESADGGVEIRCEGNLLPYSVMDQQTLVVPGEIVENKRLGAVLSLIRAGQDERDQRRLASKKLTLRQKERLREAPATVHRSPNAAPEAAIAPSIAFAVPTPPASTDRLVQALSATQPLDGRGEAMAAFMERFSAEQKARRKKHNDPTNQRKRDRELLVAKARAPGF
jgi:hypothetical protein